MIEAIASIEVLKRRARAGTAAATVVPAVAIAGRAVTGGRAGSVRGAVAKRRGSPAPGEKRARPRGGICRRRPKAGS